MISEKKSRHVAITTACACDNRISGAANEMPTTDSASTLRMTRFDGRMRCGELTDILRNSTELRGTRCDGPRRARRVTIYLSV